MYNGSSGSNYFSLCGINLNFVCPRYIHESDGGSSTIFGTYLINFLRFSEALFFTFYSPSNAFFR